MWAVRRQETTSVSCREALCAVSLSIPSLPDCGGLKPSETLRLFAPTSEVCQIGDETMPHLKSRSAHNTIEGLRHIAMRKTGRIGFLPFPPDMHASMMPKLSPQDVAFRNASLSTLRSPDTPGKRPLSLVSIVQTLLRLFQTGLPAGLPLQP